MTFSIYKTKISKMKKTLCLVALMPGRNTTIVLIITSKSCGETHQQSVTLSHVTFIDIAQLLHGTCEITIMELCLWIESTSISAGARMQRTVQSITIRRYPKRPVWHWPNLWTNLTTQWVPKTSIDAKRKSLMSLSGSICLVVNQHLNHNQTALVQFLQRKGR